MSFSHHHFNTVYSRFHDSLVGFFRSQVKDQALAEDLTQETFLKVYRNADSFDASRSMSAWVKAIARNVLIDWFRKERSENSVPLTTEINPPCARPNPELHVRLLGQRRLYRDFFRNLNPQQRRIVWLRFMRKLSDTEIARELGLSISAVRCSIYRLRNHLAALPAEV